MEDSAEISELDQDAMVAVFNWDKTFVLKFGMRELVEGMSF